MMMIPVAFTARIRKIVSSHAGHVSILERERESYARDSKRGIFVRATIRSQAPEWHSLAWTGRSSRPL